MKNVTGWPWVGLWCAALSAGSAACSYDVPSTGVRWPAGAPPERAGQPLAAKGLDPSPNDPVTDCLRTEDDPLCLSPLESREQWVEPAQRPASDPLGSTAAPLRSPGLRSPA